MTDSTELASLTIKDLRQLAGEHNIQNRSRLGKEELINALQEAIASKSAQPAASEAPAEAKASAAGAASTDQRTDDGAQDDDVPPIVRAAAASSEPASEPEMLTAESVAMLAEHPPAAGNGRSATSREGREGRDQRGALSAERQGGGPDAPHDQGQDDGHGDGQGDGSQPGERAPGDGGEGGEGGGRRRRRRRRGRGRGRRDGESSGGPEGFSGPGNDQGAHDQQGDANEGDEPGDVPGGAPAGAVRADAPPEARGDRPRSDVRPQDGDRPRDPSRRDDRGPRPQNPQQQQRPAAPQPQRQGQPPAIQGARPDLRQDRAPDNRGDQREPRNDQRTEPRNDPRNDQRNDPRRDQPRDQQRQGDQSRQPRPRLDGPQRPVPSVLDRLCVFSKGVLDLCNPDTPSWAQPRLSELLAEAGMVMVPVAGQPHPDFHEVLGAIPTRNVPPGHIAEMVSPGFALRGDRGDLFALKKARVRVAEGGITTEPQRPVVNAPAPVAPVDAKPSGDLGGDAAPDGGIEEIAPAPDAIAKPADEVAGPGLGAAPAQIPVARRDDRHRDPSQGRDGGRRGDDRAQRRGDDRNRPPRRDDRPHEGDGPREADRAPEAGDSADGGDGEAAQAPAAPRVTPRAPLPPPAVGRPPLRTHGTEAASDAPRLPLAMQVPDELAARPKAEAFRALGLNDQILADLAAIGYASPTPIQEEAIPVVISGKDLLGQAQTGTGKTAAFALPILQKLYAAEGDGPIALVLCPTRELARQVAGEFTRMAGASGARSVVIYGGVPMDDQVRALERKPHVVIGTPGRIIDHMRRKILDLSRLQIAVLDEADQMLDIGFWPDVNFIISHTPPQRQTLLFSATFPEPVKVLAEKHMKDPVSVRIQPKHVTVAQVDQKYIAVARDRKNELLAHFIDTQKPEQLLVFCRTKHQTDRVAEVLKRKHMSAAAIHGDLPQSKREKTLLSFRNRELQCLIATNVAARGLDIPSVSHVVNYDIPEMPEEYVHRIGRTARNGAQGVARTFITPEDGQFLVEIEKHIGLLLEEEHIEGFTQEHAAAEVKRSIAEMPVGQPRILKPLVGGIRLGRRRK